MRISCSCAGFAKEAFVAVSPNTAIVSRCIRTISPFSQLTPALRSRNSKRSAAVAAPLQRDVSEHLDPQRKVIHSGAGYLYAHMQESHDFEVMLDWDQ